MGILRHRRFRRAEIVPNDDDPEAEEYDDDEEGDEDDDLTATTIAGLPPTSTENQFDKAKAIGKDVIEKVPSMYLFVKRNYLSLINRFVTYHIKRKRRKKKRNMSFSIIIYPFF
jgi:hypothetical protein